MGLPFSCCNHSQKSLKGVYSRSVHPVHFLFRRGHRLRCREISTP